MVYVIIIIAVVWFGLGILSSGYVYNYSQLQFPSISEKYERSDYVDALAEIPMGLAAMLSTLSTGMTSHGTRFRRYKYINGVRQP